MMKLITTALAALLLASCAAMTDGGIVGSGQRVDCERTPEHELCKQRR